MCIVVNQKKKKNDNDIEAYFYFYLQSVDRLFPFVRMRNTIVSFLEQQKE